MKYYDIFKIDGTQKIVKAFKNKQECIKWVAEENMCSDDRLIWSENYLMNFCLTNS